MVFTEKQIRTLHAALMTDTEIAKVLDRRVSSPVRKTGFAPVQVQTGAGKTRAALRAAVFVAARNLSASGETRQVLYTTPRVENIRMEMMEIRTLITELRASKIINATQEKALMDAVIVFPGRKDIVSDLLAWMSDPAQGLARQFPHGHPRPVAKGKNLEALYKAVTGEKRARPMTFLKDALAPLRLKSKPVEDLTNEQLDEIISALDNIFLPQNDEVAEVAERIVNRNAPEARMLFPRLFVTTPGSAHIVLMSTKRLLYPVRGAIKGDSESFLGAGKNGSRIVFLDEGDAAFSEMSKHAFEPLDKSEIDIASVVQGFAKLSTQFSFFDSARINTKLEELVRVCAAMCEVHKFHAPLRISRETRESLRGSVPESLGDASTWEFSTVISSVQHDPRSGTILVPREDGLKSLNAFFNDVRADFDFKFATALLALVNEVQVYLRDNARTSVEKTRITRRSALSYLLKQVRLDTENRKAHESVLITVLDARMENIIHHEKATIGVPLCVHDLGLRFAKIWHSHQGGDDLPDTSYQIYALAAPKTPNAMVLSLARHHLVIGLSATMNAPTVSRNFHHAYLRRRLGADFIEMTGSEMIALHAAYADSRRYDDAIGASGLSVERHEIDGVLDDALVEVIQTGLTGTPITDGVSVNARDVAQFVNACRNDKNVAHHEAIRVVRILKAVQAFLSPASSPEHESVRMMAFLGVGLTKWKGVLTETMLPPPETMIRVIAEEMGRRVGKTPSVHPVLTADLRNMDEKQWPASPESPLIILTTYATAGAGFNLQQRITEPESHLVNIGSYHAVPSTVDFDAVYLDRSAYPVLRGDERSPAGKIQNAYTVQTMGEACVLSQADMRDILRDIVRATPDQFNKIMGRVNKTEEARHAYMSEIIQALGRLSRTGMRRKTLKYMVSKELMPFLSASARDYPAEAVSWEFRRICEWAAQTCKPLAGANARDTSVLRSQAASMVRRLLNGLWGENPAPYVEEWLRLRADTARYPTAEAVSEDTAAFLIPDLNGTAQRVLFSSAEDLTKTDFSPLMSDTRRDDAPHRHESSEAATRLPWMMRNPVIKAHFEALGYATSWEPKGWVLDPVICQSIYTGEIGEQAVRALLTDHGVPLGDMPEGQFEIFDMVAGAVPLDAKNYGGGFSGLTHTMRQDMIAGAVHKARRISAPKVILVSVFGKEDGVVQYLQEGGVEIVLVDGVLTQDGQPLSESLNIIADNVRTA